MLAIRGISQPDLMVQKLTPEVQKKIPNPSVSSLMLSAEKMTQAQTEPLSGTNPKIWVWMAHRGAAGVATLRQKIRTHMLAHDCQDRRVLQRSHVPPMHSKCSN